MCFTVTFDLYIVIFISSCNILRSKTVTIDCLVILTLTVRTQTTIMGYIFPQTHFISIQVIECGHFWAQYADDENHNALAQVQQALNMNAGQNLRVK